MANSPDLLQAAIDASGHSARAFASVLAVDERTVRRWLAEDRGIPGPVVQLCRLIVHDPSLVDILSEGEA